MARKNTVFDLVTANEITAYWETLAQDRTPYLGDELFTPKQKLGLKLEFIKGSQGLPIVLKPSAYDVAALKRKRIGFQTVESQMPFFKESQGINEELRQQLNMVLETGNAAYIDAVMNRIFDDQMSLLEGASAQRERMKMMLLTTGMIDIVANGQNYSYDYGMPATHKSTVAKSWSDPSADIISDIKTWQDKVEDDTGVRPTRATCSRKTWGYFLINTGIRNAIWGNSASAPVTDTRVQQYIMSELDLEVAVYTKRFIDETGATQKFVDDDVFVLFPTGTLGSGWFGTTPEQSDLLAGSTANVSITDTGVAVTTTKNTDPVTVDTKVSMIYLPSFETIDQIYIADVSV
jgi:hypothetical protein